ncbi:MAG TPA: UDP-3-O-(3-hydroxymyristoyl)glucosamine N-acyltransferase [Chitinophagaceae bacterium]|nr:UDP-3-O-(3-hydroxymyristoyl)glucosamine N-acyltransferase [Chitinophagaceae bacterium]
MRFPSPVSLEWLAGFLGATLVGNKDAQATGINELHKVEKGDLAFVDHPKYYTACLQSAADFIIINTADVTIPPGKALLVTDAPFEAYLAIVRHFRPFEKASALVSSNAQIGSNSYIAPGSFIGNHVTIGDNCIIQPNVTILDHCIIGNNVYLQSGTVIGSDAFYYNGKKSRELWYKRMESCGRVIIQDDVEIGANCCIDRGVTHDTIVGRGTKMDNLIHIGHDTVIGKNCLFAAQVIVGGCVNIEDGVTLWGQVVVNKTLTIGANAVLLGKTGVVGDIAGNKTYWGTPAQEAGAARRELVWIKRIPELWNKVMNP